MAKRGSVKSHHHQSNSGTQNGTAEESSAAAAAAFLKHFQASGLSGNGTTATGYKQLSRGGNHPSYLNDQPSSGMLENGTALDEANQSSPTSLATISGGTLVVGGNGSGSSSGNSPQNNNSNFSNSTNPFRMTNSTATSNGHIANQHSASNFRSNSSALNNSAQQQAVLLNGSSSLHSHHHLHNHHQQVQQQQQQQQPQQYHLSSTGGGGGHYAANLAAGLQQQQQSSAKKTATNTSTSLLLDPTRITSATSAAQFHQQHSTSPLSLLGENTAATDPASSSSMLVPPNNHHHHHSNHHSSARVITCSTCSSLHWGGGLRENLASLALMCILSLLTAFLALFFLQRSCPLTTLGFTEGPLGDLQSNNHTKSPGAKNHALILSQSTSSVTPTFNQRLTTGNASNRGEYLRVFQISVCLSTLTIALNLCCLFVCAIQFLSIVKLLKVTTPFGIRRAADFIKRTSHIRVLAFGAFLLSIPIFFTGVILYTFVNFDEVPALVTSLIIGLGIIFCGIASVQNVYLWQWEKTKASQDLRHSQAAMHMQQQQQQQQLLQQHQHQATLSAGHLQQQQQQGHSHHQQPHPHQQQQHSHQHLHQPPHQISAASNYPLELSTLV